MPNDLPRAAAFLLGFWLALLALSPIGTAHVTDDPDAGLRKLEAKLHHAVNAFRREHHRIPLERNAELDRIARAHSRDMASRGYFAHETPEGINPVQRLTQAGLDGFSLAAENVGLTNRALPNREIVREWLASPAHRTNLMAPAFNTTGIGIARAASGALYYTQLYVTFPQDETSP